MGRTSTSRLLCAGLCVVPVVVAWSAAPAHADLRLCNRTSYVLDLALGLEEKDTAATRGWFRVDPGQCRGVLWGTIEADQVYVFARALAVYGPLAAAAGRPTSTPASRPAANFLIAQAIRGSPGTHQSCAFYE